MTRRLLIPLLLLLSAVAPAPAATPDDGARTLALVRQWVHGRYHNQAQFDRDIAAGVPDAQIHRVMHQLFVPVRVPVPALAGYLVFQQASANGSEDPATIVRVGLVQYVPDAATGQLRQRELNFRNPEAYKNAHRHQDVLRNLTVADFNVDTGCDFWLSMTADGREVRGQMKGQACRFWSRGIRQELIADDAVVIRPAEYWFWGRFVDATGKVRWGTESPELNQLVRVGEP